MEQYLLQTFGKKRSKDQPKKDKNQVISELTHTMTINRSWEGLVWFRSSNINKMYPENGPEFVSFDRVGLKTSLDISLFKNNRLTVGIRGCLSSNFILKYVRVLKGSLGLYYLYRMLVTWLRYQRIFVCMQSLNGHFWPSQTSQLTIVYDP